MKKRIFLFSLLALLIAGNAAAQKQNFVVPEGMTATAYPGHTELNWKNRTAFIYEVYRSTDAGKTFTKEITLP